MAHDTTDFPKLPPDLIETARQLISTQDATQWVVGDFLAEVIDELQPHFQAAGTRVPRAEIIRQISTATGSDPSTLRDRECMARFFTLADRADFDMLTYSQLRACKAAGPAWRDFATRAADNLPAPVTVIRGWISAAGAGVPAWVGELDRISVLADRLAHDDQAPQAVADFGLAAGAVVQWLQG